MVYGRWSLVGLHTVTSAAIPPPISTEKHGLHHVVQLYRTARLLRPCPPLKLSGRRLLRGMAKVKRGKTERSIGSEFFDRLVIECVTPELDAGRYPVKRIVGDLCEIG